MSGTSPGRDAALVRFRLSPASVRSRLIIVILLAVFPLTASAAFLAWRGYEEALGHSARRTETALIGFLADQDEAVREAAAGLRALGTLPGIAAPETCPALAAIALRLSGGHLDAIAVRDGDGHLVCSSGDGLPDLDGVATVPLDGTPSLRLARIAPLPHGRWAIPIRVSPTAGIRIDADVAVDLAALGRQRTGAVIGAAWTRTDTGPELLAGDAAVLPPSSGVLAALASGNRSALETDAAGRLHAYSIGALPEGTRVVSGDFANDDESRATILLVRRFVAIALLLLLELVIVAVGAHVTVAAPIRALTRRVTRWQSGGGFDTGHMRFVPSELAALILVFGQATAALAERERQLERATSEQELLIKEIHHRVKNNLQIIASLLNLQANRIRAPEAKAEFGAARDRVRALATLHRHLYSEGGLHTIAMRPFILELCGQLLEAMGEREGRRIQLEVEAPEIEMSSDQAVPLALVVTEAVSNAIKYAFPNGRSGHVAVRLTRSGANTLELVVQDDGIGIPAGRAETETGIRDGLGIQLIRGFARQLGATLTITEDNGTRYHLVLERQTSRSDPARAVSVA